MEGQTDRTKEEYHRRFIELDLTADLLLLRWLHEEAKKQRRTVENQILHMLDIVGQPNYSVKEG